MTIIKLKRGDKYKIETDNPIIHIVGINTTINGKSEHYDIEPIYLSSAWYGGNSIEKNAISRITIQKEDRDYEIFFNVSYGKLDEKDSDKYIFINESLSKMYINDKDEFIDIAKEFDNDIFESFEIEVKNQEE